MFSFGRKKLDSHRAFVLGLDYAGKKAAMYRFMRGTKEVERIPPNFMAGQLIEKFNFKNGTSYELMALGGCGRYKNPWQRSCPQEADFIVVVVDASDQDRLAEVVEVLSASMPLLVDQVKARDMWILFNKQDLVAEGIREKYVDKARREVVEVTDKWASEFTVRIADTPGLSAIKDEGMQGVVDEIAAFLQNRDAGSLLQKPAGEGHSPLGAVGPGDELLKARISEANNAATSSDAFWESILGCTVGSWDHYNHLRAGYFVVLDAASQGKGMVACSDTFLLLLNQLREADPKRFAKIPNRTMTTFWLVQLRLATVSYQVDHGLSSLPDRDDFGMVLLENNHLMDVLLWRQYYSKDVLFSPQARDEWCLPDIKSFPPGKVASGLRVGEKS